MSAPKESPWFLNPQPRWEATWRLIGFPHGGGGPHAFREWPGVLHEHVEMLAVHLPGRGSRLHEPPVSDMDELVTGIVAAMTDCFDKPFAFVGHSVGALVAYETARRLGELGLPTPLRLFASAHHAPHAVAAPEPMYQLPDEDLIDVVGNLGLVPQEALADPELLALILPPLRADFALSETYRAPERSTALPCPITALGGTHDPLLSPDDLQEWQAYSAEGFAVRTFEGDHFYTTTHLAQLGEAIAQDVAGDIAALPPSILAGAEADYPRTACLHELFRAQAAQSPGSLALVDGADRFTFQELDSATDLLARELQGRGVQVDSLVGIYLPTSADFVAGYLGALKAGGAYMPLDLTLPPAALAEVLQVADPVAIITDDEHAGGLPRSWHERGAVVRLGPGWQERLGATDLPELDAGADSGRRRLPGPDSLAYCVMSSGTTGVPKGIICPHRGAVNSYSWRLRHLPYQGEEREACNVFFVWEVLRPMLAGRTAYVIPDEVIFDPARLVAYLRDNAITRVLFTPSLLDTVLSTPGLDLESAFAHLRILYLNGEVVPTALQQRFTRRFPDIALVNDYSISETHDVCTSDLSELDARITPKFAPVGTPMDNVRIVLLDEARRPVPWGFVGEIYVGGDSLARGYLAQPEMTAQRFIPDPVRGDGSVLFRTGDAGRFLPDGRLEIHGRIAFMIKLRGYSIVPGAVEAALLSHPEVAAAFVTTIDDPETGQPEHLVAYVVPGGAPQDEAELVAALRSHLKDRLPPYAVPSYILAMQKLPLSGTGKLNRRALPDPRKRRQVGAASRTGGAGRSAPAQPGAQAQQLERFILSVWEQVLDSDGLDPESNFFDVGGHSLAAAAVCAHLREHDLDVSVVDVFQYPSARLLARHLTPAGEGAPTSAPMWQPGRQSEEPIAIVGLACRFPGAPDAQTFWENLRDGVGSIRELSTHELAERGVPEEIYAGPDYRRIGAILDDVEAFDPAFWGLSRKEALLMDPQHRLFLECAWHALENAGHAPRSDGARTGVFGGTFLPTYLLHHLHGGGLLDPTDPMQAHLTEIGNDKDYVATRVSHLLNLQGPSLAIQTSCSTSLVTVATACQALRAGQCDTALAGASSITFPQAGYQYVEGHISSSDGHVRPFDANASGTILGDGVGVVVLKRLSDALDAGDNVLALITGFATNNDGALKAGYSAPSVAGQSQVVAAAHEMAGADPETFSYLECHGTGTLIGDPIEVRALTEVFRRTTDRRGFCALGSVKGGIGHSNIAAGMAGLIKTVLALQHRQIPPVVDFETPNPGLELQSSPFYIADELRPWEAPPGSPRRAGVSCFGIGGTNAHLVVEEFDPQTAGGIGVAGAAQDAQGAAEVDGSGGQPGQSAHLFVMSARSATSLGATRDALVAALKPSAPDASPLDLAAAAHTLARGREHFEYRLSATGSDPSAVQASLAGAKGRQVGAQERAAAARIVFMFPGQGAQYPAMGAGLYADVPEFARHYDECADILAAEHDIDLRAVAFADPAAPDPAPDAPAQDEFSRAYYLQPALFAMEYALAATLMDWGVRPAALVGHSLGEYVAATLAGVLQLRDALALVQARAHAMEEAGPGAMLAVKLGVDEARALVADADDIDLAVINSPRDVVFSGRVEAVERLAAQLAEAGIAAQLLHTSRAFHSMMMQEAAARVGAAAATLQLNPPQIPLVSNLTGQWLTNEQALDPTYWSRHLRGEVRFADDVAALLEAGPAVYLELGPGRTLSGLLTSIAAEGTGEASANGAEGGPPPLAVPLGRHPLRTDAGDAQVLLEGLGRLWEAGVPIDWEAFYASRSRRRVPLPGYSFERVRCWPTDPGGGALPGGGSSGTAAAAPADSKMPLERWFYLPSWRRTLPPVLNPAEPSRRSGQDPALPPRWLVFVPESGPGARLGASLIAALNSRGDDVVCVEPDLDRGHEDPICFLEQDRARIACSAAGHEALLRALDEQGRRPDRIVHLWSLAASPQEPRRPRAALNVTQLAVALTRVAFAEPVQLWIVAAGAVQVDGEPVDPLASPLLGPALVVAQENPAVACHVIDVGLEPVHNEPDDDLGELADPLLRECTAAEPDEAFIVSYRGGRRWVPAYEPVTVPSGPSRIRPGGVYLITGGLGRIGRTLAEHLLAAEATVVLTTRAPVTDEGGIAAERAGDADLSSTAEFLTGCRERGGKVFLVQADASYDGDLERAVQHTIKRHGRLDGIFHAAGLAQLTYLSEVDEALIEREFAPKVAGLLELDRAVAVAAGAGAAPEFVVVFSSIAGTLGGLAMSAYMGANRFMDAFVQADPRRHGVDWFSIAWDDWDFEYSTQQIEAYTASGADKFAMSPEQGLTVLERILAFGVPGQLLVSTRPLEPRLRQWVDQPAPSLAAPPEGEPGETAGESGQPGGSDLHARLIGVYRAVLGVEQVDVDDNFFDLGGDSLLAAQILSQLRSTLGLSGQIRLQDVFTYPSVAALARYVQDLV
ncbi:type I polyketide synthase [Gephyromycinifex aptenodytis]|uniref:type I polyketide synthase n=1 Tax=Gephyromycinifex aptenodytis TaxID=2716227 RepID=UPI0014468E34|nr:type I polyketide synthase [Gephyromycinifex aptenodytis]